MPLSRDKTSRGSYCSCLDGQTNDIDTHDEAPGYECFVPCEDEAKGMSIVREKSGMTIEEDRYLPCEDGGIQPEKLNEVAVRGYPTREERTSQRSYNSLA